MDIPGTCYYFGFPTINGMKENAIVIYNKAFQNTERVLFSLFDKNLEVNETES